ncbi:LOW QUALITY PROTEIN: adenylate kinase 9 [Pristis pectinata]|uniref:LOW QUALITY PROTEIN: adenylate kinase 9 n=1 Tax=Pristis pectinata TaxID=685728 RepID=UPI00223CDBD5|nr:LOW QUALITY PROTEIN: adenylate kinase 9 [Pristis pectinata]
MEAEKHKQAPLVFTDIIDEDESERELLLSKPTCFFIVGKPCIGKRTLAKSLAEAWKSILVEPQQLIQQNLDENTETGKMFQECLLRGESIHEELVMNLMLDKLRSPEVGHHGYILCGFPSLSEEYLRIPEQIEIIRNLHLKPDFIINIKCPDHDLCDRVSGQRQDPVTGRIYQQEEWNPDKADIEEKKKENEEEEEKEEEEEFEEMEEEEKSEVTPELVARLVKRPEDLLSTFEKRVALYKDKLLRPLEDYMADHDPQYLIELDGNRKPSELFMSLMYKLEFMGLQPTATAQLLHDDEEEEIPEETEDDDLFRAVAALKRTAPGYRWRRSKWGRICPVSLFNGNFVLGKSQFAASFLDKMYFLSSEEALKKFLNNPRPYLLPPQPHTACKIAILGPKSAGKTTLCELIALSYDAKVLDMSQFIQPHQERLRFENIEKVRMETLQSAIVTVKNKLEKEISEHIQAQPVPLVADVINEEEDQSPSVTRNKELAMDEISSLDVPGEAEPTEDPQPPITDDTTEVPVNLDAIKSIVEEVTEDHPDVKAIVNEAVEKALQAPVELPVNAYMDVLAKAISEINEERKQKNPDHPVAGGWVLDHFPETVDQCKAMVELGFTPDNIFLLHNAVDDGKFLLNRLYNLNKNEIDFNIIHRLQAAEAKKKLEKQAALDALKETENPQPESVEMKEENEVVEEIEATSQSKSDDQPSINENVLETKPSFEPQPATAQGSEAAPSPASASEPQSVAGQGSDAALPQASASDPQSEPEPEIKLPEVPEGGYPEGPEMDQYRKILSDYMQKWNLLDMVLTTSVNTKLEIAGKTPEALLEEVVEVLNKPYQYSGWELSGTDLDEEDEDAEAAAEETEEEGAAEEEEEMEEELEEDEDAVQRKNRQMGESKHYCPVAIKRKISSFPGDRECAARYREKYYYFSNPDARDKFLKSPEDYINEKEPLKAPPLRLFVFGAKGSGKTTHSRWLANKLGIFHIQFTELLQERIIPKTKRKIGPEYDDEPTEDELADLATIAALERGEQPEKIEDEPEEKQEEEEVEFSPEEEAIKSFLTEDEPLPPDVLDNLIPKWWNEEPFKSKGFVLDGFPSTADEVEYLTNNRCSPDTAILIKVEDNKVLDWLLPPRLAKWRRKHNQKLERKNKIKELKKKIKDEQIAKRREELLAERAERKKERQANKPEPTSEESEASGEEEEEDEDEDEENIEDILADEFMAEEEEVDEEEEEESEVIEQMRTDIGEKYDSDQERISALRDQLKEFLIPCIVINGNRKPHIVHYQLHQKVEPLVKNRISLFEKCFPVNIKLAQKLLDNSYKRLSSFGRWDIVELSEGNAIQPIQDMQQNIFPVVHRKYVYYFVSKQNRDKFIENPFKYITQPKPRPPVPIKIAIVGPPKSGKSTVARRFASEFGLQRISAGEAIRTVLTTQRKTALAVNISKHIKQGLIVPDIFVVKCLEMALMDVVCNTRGFVLDGYPVTREQINLLNSRKIIPVRIIELQTDIKEILKRGLIDKRSPDRIYPLHDSSQILTIRNSSFSHEISAIWEYYQREYQNWHIIYGQHSKWWVWLKVLEDVKVSVKQIEEYLERISEGKAASIAGLCITPYELQSRLGEFGQYCPVTLQLQEELQDCSVDPSLEFAAEFRGHYYKMASKEALDTFLENPEMFVPPLVTNTLPPPDMLPIRLTAAGVKARFPKHAELQGYCPVTFLDGKERYEALIPGHIDYAAEYRNKIYFLQDEKRLNRFMRRPEKYWDLKLPSKLPPMKDPVALTSLPMLGYMEQGAAVSIIKALTAVGCLKPKYPFLSVKKSALLYISYHLKAYNPKSYDYVRKKYKKKLEQYEEHCELISYLGSKMTRKYKEPKDRPIDFDHKLQTFLSLKNAEPTLTSVP